MKANEFWKLTLPIKTHTEDEDERAFKTFLRLQLARIICGGFASLKCGFNKNLCHEEEIRKWRERKETLFEEHAFLWMSLL